MGVIKHTTLAANSYTWSLNCANLGSITYAVPLAGLSNKCPRNPSDTSTKMSVWSRATDTLKGMILM